MARLIGLLSPANHSSPVGLLATRIYTNLLSILAIHKRVRAAEEQATYPFPGSDGEVVALIHSDCWQSRRSIGTCL